VLVSIGSNRSCVCLDFSGHTFGTMPKKGKATRKTSGSPTRKLTAEGIANKTCKDNYITKGMTEDEVFVMRIDGFTLFDVTVRDQLRKKSDVAFKMNCKYYNEQRAKYRHPEHASKRLRQVPSGTNTVDPALLKAMVAFKRNPLDNEPFQLYLGQAKMPNETELVGTFKWAVELSPNHPKQFGALMDLLRFCERHRVDKTFPAQWKMMRDLFDRTLVAARLKSKKVTPEAFCTMHSKLLDLLMDPAKLKIVIASDKKYELVGDELLSLSSSCLIGDCLWSFAVLKLIASNVERFINQEVAAFAAKEMTLESLNFAKFDISTRVLLLEGVAKLTARRDCILPYKGDSIPCRVTSIPCHVNYALAAAWKGVAVETLKLSKLFCEAVLVQCVGASSYRHIYQ
jgi:hypothetical protein